MFDSLIASLDLSTDNAPDVRAEVQRVLASPGLDEGVKDECDRPFVTIDNPGSRDLDQALHVEAEGEGWVIRYALADASYYVRPGSALWRRSLERGASYYFPDRALPMLPEALSEGLISLNPGVERRALCFVMRVTAEGERMDASVERVRIRSRGKLSYEGVQAWFDGHATDEAAKVERSIAADARVRDALEEFAEVGFALLEAQRRRGVVALDRQEADVRVQKGDPGRLVAVVRKRNDVERWNEQVSLLCNIEGARMLREVGRQSDDVQAVYRVHLPPLRERLVQLRELLDALAAHRGLGGAWRWKGQDVGAFLEGLPQRPRLRRLRAAVHRQVRYTYRASSFRARSGPHHALGVDGYSRMSSPMREAVGVFSHKELLEGLGQIAPAPAADDVETRAHVIEAANASKKRQRAIDKAVDLMLLEQLFRDDLSAALGARPWRTGTVVGVRASRLYVALDGVAVDVKVYTDDLAKAHGGAFRLERGVALVGPVRFVLGDALCLRVRAWNPGTRRFELDAQPAARPAAS